MNNKVQIWGLVTLSAITTLSLFIDYTIRFWNFGWIIVSLVLFVLGTVLVISIYLNKEYIFNNKNKIPFKNKLKLLIDNTFTGSLIDLSFIVYFILSCEWIPNSLMNYAQNGEYWQEPLIYITGFIVAIVFKPFYDMNSSVVDNSKRKLLITSVSPITYKPSFTNFTPFIKPFGKYLNIEKILVLLPDEIIKGYDNNILDWENNPLNHYFKNYKKSINEVNEESKEKIDQIIETIVNKITTIIQDKLCVVNSNLPANNDEKTEINTNESIKAVKEMIKQNYSFLLRCNFDKMSNELIEFINGKPQNFHLAHFDVFKKELREFILRDYSNVLLLINNEKRITDALKILIQGCIKTTYNNDKKRKKGINIVFTKPVDCNNFYQCEKMLNENIKSTVGGYSDENIIVNISPGTKIVTSVLTLNAIEGNRGLIYTEQNRSELVEYNPDVIVLRNYIEKLSNELAEKVSSN